MHNVSEMGVGNVVQQWYGVVKLVVMFSFPLFLKVRCVEKLPLLCQYCMVMVFIKRLLTFVL